ncbi:MAG: hypothetical protein J5674_05485, partial [Candidatus Methanomethylophilaceae archaeon]|nr:hypothetical protein [Candidatus Methanomethylophilaceae archaeon]
MRPLIFVAVAVAGFATMVVAACDYIINVGPYDTAVFVAGTVAAVAGYVMASRSMRAGGERSHARIERRVPLAFHRIRQHAPVERP